MFSNLKFILFFLLTGLFCGCPQPSGSDADPADDVLTDPVIDDTETDAETDTETEILLSSLTVSEGTLVPDFASDVFNYTVNLEGWISGVGFHAEASDAGVIIDYSPGKNASLVPGETDFTITLTSEDGESTRIYQIEVHRESLLEFSADGVSYKMCYCPAAADFVMGPSDESTATVDSFFLAETEVTYQLWSEVKSWAESNGYTFGNPGVMGSHGSGDSDMSTAHPVTAINYRDALVFCNALTEYCNFKNNMNLVCSYTDGDNIIRDSRDSNGTICDTAQIPASSNGFRLPSNEEWECAARYIDGRIWLDKDRASGADAPYGSAGASDAVAWFRDNSGNKAHSAAGKKANALGIYDMNGNVAEWVYKNTGTNRVLRGGNWFSLASRIRVGSGSETTPDSEYERWGFRLAISVP